MSHIAQGRSAVNHRFVRVGWFDRFLLPLQVGCLSLTVLSIIGLVWVTNRAASKAYRLADAQEHLQVLTEEQHRLTILIQEHQTLRHIDESARFLGFVPSAAPRFVEISAP